MLLTQLKIPRIAYVATTAALALCPEISRADEGGVSFWLPGRYASFAAAPQVPGWALGVIYYHTNVAAFGNVAASKEIIVGRIPANVNVNLNLSLAGQGDLIVLAPSYTFAQPVLGGQLSLSVSSWFGRDTASIAGTLTASTGSVFATRTGMIEDALTSYGDIVPTATLRWNSGVNNFMTYLTGDTLSATMIRRGLQILVSGTERSMQAEPTLISTPPQEMSSPPSPALPTTSRIPIRNTAAASISTSTGVHRTSSRSSFSSVSPDMPISKSPTIPVKTRFWAASGRAFSASVRRLDTTSPWAACRASWV
jgi:hypothetical protein